MSNSSVINHHPHRNGTAQQACAACKYQRRKCAPDCLLAPYFPHDRTRQFLNAHRLFGVKKITKIISNLPPNAKDHAMQSIIYQSDARAADPVGGCARIIRQLEREIEFCAAELNVLMHQLAICRGHLQQQFNQLGGYEMPYFGEQDEEGRGEEYLKLADDHDQQDLGEEPARDWVMQDSMSTLNIKSCLGHNGLFGGGDDEIKTILELPGDEMKTLLDVPNDERFELKTNLEVLNDERFELKYV